eukprot:9397979-Pyramimonas_sp.AAC.1
MSRVPCPLCSPSFHSGWPEEVPRGPQAALARTPKRPPRGLPLAVGALVQECVLEASGPGGFLV